MREYIAANRRMGKQNNKNEGKIQDKPKKTTGKMRKTDGTNIWGLREAKPVKSYVAAHDSSS